MPGTGGGGKCGVQLLVEVLKAQVHCRCFCVWIKDVSNYSFFTFDLTRLGLRRQMSKTKDVRQAYEALKMIGFGFIKV